MIPMGFSRKFQELKDRSATFVEYAEQVANTPRVIINSEIYQGDQGGSGTVIDSEQMKMRDIVSGQKTFQLGKGTLGIDKEEVKVLRKSERLPKYAESDLPKKVDKYKLFKVVGEGQFGKVYLCQDTKRPLSEPRVLLAMKRIEIPETIPDKRSFQQELSAYRQIRGCKHVVEVHDILRTQHKMSIVMEFCNCGSIDRKMQWIFKGNEKLIKRLAKHILRALDATHRKKFIHRDVKPDNIFINVPLSSTFAERSEKPSLMKSEIQFTGSKLQDQYSTFSSASTRCEDGPLKLLQESIENNDKIRATDILSQATFKLGDYGFCRQNKVSCFRGFYGTPNYMSPQVLLEREYSMKADIYSLGVMLYTLFYNRTPFRSGNIQTLSNDVSKGQFVIESSLPLSREGLEFITLCMRGTEKDRPSASELLKHPWFTSSCRQQSLTETLNLSIYKKIASIQFRIQHTYWKGLWEQFKKNSAKSTYSSSISQEWATVPLRQIKCWFSAYSLYSAKCLKKIAGQILAQIKYANCNMGLCYGAVDVNNIEVDVPRYLLDSQAEYLSFYANQRHKKQSDKQRKMIAKKEKEAYRHIKSARFRLLKPIFLQYRSYNECIKESNLSFSDVNFNDTFSYQRDIFCFGEMLYKLMISKQVEDPDLHLICSAQRVTPRATHERTLSQSFLEEKKIKEPLRWPVPSTKRNNYELKLKKNYLLKEDELDFISRCLRIDLYGRLLEPKKVQEYEEELSNHLFLTSEKEQSLVTDLATDQVLVISGRDEEQTVKETLMKILQ